MVRPSTWPKPERLPMSLTELFEAGGPEMRDAYIRELRRKLGIRQPKE